MDRRALFFFACAAVCALLAPVTTESLRYVPEVFAVVYFVLAVASYLNWRTTRR